MLDQGNGEPIPRGLNLADLRADVGGEMRQCVTLCFRRRSWVISSSRKPVKKTPAGTPRKEIFPRILHGEFYDGRPLRSLFRLLTIVVTRMISMPAACILSMARSFIDHRLPTWRWLLASFPMPSNCRYA